MLIGSIPCAYSKGKYANLISELLAKQNVMNASNLKDSTVSNESCILSNLILFDRDEDYVSVFLSQLNYVGILDETFSIKSGKLLILFLSLFRSLDFNILFMHYS